MSERTEPELPYNTIHSRDWGTRNEINIDDEFPHLSTHYESFLFAKLRSNELSKEFEFRQEIEQALGIEHCRLVPNPYVRPGGYVSPEKVYEAPEGMAFKITTVFGDDDEIAWVPTYDIADNGFVGKHLEIEDLYILRDGTKQATIVVRDLGEAYAAPTLDYGDYNWVNGPAEEDYIRLPSRADPTKDGARVWFPKPGGIQIFYSGAKIRAPFGAFEIEIIPQEEKTSEVYVADFSSLEQPALDDFMFIDESPVFPKGIGALPTREGGYRIVPNAVGLLVLPPIAQDDWTDLWEKHNIMLKWNPTVREDRFVRMDYRYRQESVERQVRRFNSGQANGRMFMRALAVQFGTSKITLKEVIEAAVSDERLSLEELLAEEKRY